MNEEQKYWRDKSTQILQWGLGIYLLLFGWSMDKHDEFELFPKVVNSLWSEEMPRGQFLRAAGLMLFGIIYAVALPLAIHLIYKHYLQNTDTDKLDKTVLPYRLSIAGTIVLSSLTLLVAITTSVW
ncbi:MAG TPA: hypothetical protein VF297_10550 [Pyrinomonadaceae bacterium]